MSKTKTKFGRARSPEEVAAEYAAAPGKNRRKAGTITATLAIGPVTVSAGRPSLVDEVAAIKPASRKWDFTPAQRAEVDEVRARVTAGTLYISALALARVVKARYNLPWSVGSIRAKLTEIAGGKW